MHALSSAGRSVLQLGQLVGVRVNGAEYQGLLVEVRGEHALLRFNDGSQRWFGVTDLTARPSCDAPSKQARGKPPVARILALIALTLIASALLLAYSKQRATSQAREENDVAVQRIIAQHRSATTTRLSELDAIAQRPLPKQSGTSIRYAGPPLRDFQQGGTLVVLPANPKGDAKSRAPADATPSHFLNTPKDLLDVRDLLRPSPLVLWVPGYYEGLFKRVEAISWVLLVRQLDVREAIISGDSYLGEGDLTGDAFLFDIRGQSYGGFAFQAQNGKQFRYYSTGTASKDGNALSAGAHAALYSAALRALCAEFARQIPGSSIDCSESP